MHDEKIPTAILKLQNALDKPPGGHLCFEHSATREFVALSLTTGDSADGLLASPQQLKALMTGLKASEALISRLDVSSIKSSGLSIEVVTRGETKREATQRSVEFGKMLDAALASALPFVEIRPKPRRRGTRRFPHQRMLSPQGHILPLGNAVNRARLNAGRTTVSSFREWNASQHDVIVFSSNADGRHLAGLGAVVAAIKSPLIIEVCLTRNLFDAETLKQVDDVRRHIHERLHADMGQGLRDSRYTEADKRLETLFAVGSGVKLEVRISSKRILSDHQMSALSAALFGAPHAEHQAGYLASLRSLYPEDEGIISFLGILAAAIAPTIERQQHRELESLEGSVIGKTKSGHVVRMPVDHPRSHTAIFGRSGCGKSVFLQNSIHQIIEARNEAVVVMESHGDLIEGVHKNVAAHLLKHFELFDMGDQKLRPQLNLLELGPGDPDEARAKVIDTVCQFIRQLMFSGLTIDATGPLFNKYMRAALRLILEAEGRNAQIGMLERVFVDEDYRDELIQRDGVSSQTRNQWFEILAVDSNEHKIQNMAPWITSKMSVILQSGILLPILGATSTNLDFDRIFAEKKVCLINLASGVIGAEAARLLGGILTYRIEQSAKRQACMPAANRNKASIFFDEFPTFASEFLRPLMSESRKFGLKIYLAAQTLSQMTNNAINGGVLHEVLGNCANSVIFAVDVDDARYLAPRFGGKIDAATIVSQPNYNATCMFQTPTGSAGPFSITTLPPPHIDKRASL